MDTEARFWPKVDRSGGPDACWRWLAAKSGNGYGAFYFRGRWGLAYRCAYELLVGPIPEGLQIDHLCRVRDCVNPTHLEPVTHRENLLRGEGVAAQHAAKTHCPRGHPYSGVNLYVYPAPRGQRECRECRRQYQRRLSRRRRAAAELVEVGA